MGQTGTLRRIPTHPRPLFMHSPQHFRVNGFRSGSVMTMGSWSKKSLATCQYASGQSVYTCTRQKLDPQAVVDQGDFHTAIPEEYHDNPSLTRRDSPNPPKFTQRRWPPNGSAGKA